MSTTSTRLTFDEFLKLPEREGTHYELDEGELVIEPSLTFLHNRIRDRIADRLREFVKAHRLGEVIVEMDFRLGPDTVRNPDVAFVTAQHLQTIDVNHSPGRGRACLRRRGGFSDQPGTRHGKESQPISVGGHKCRVASSSGFAAG